MMSVTAVRLIAKLGDLLSVNVDQYDEFECCIRKFEEDTIDETRRLLADAAHKAIMDEYVEGQ
jgi:hypothetical protein